MFSFEELMKEDPQIAEAIEAEVKRQNSHIELIASENCCYFRFWNYNL